MQNEAENVLKHTAASGIKRDCTNIVFGTASFYKLSAFFLVAYKYRYRVVPYLCEARRQSEFIRLFSNAVF